MITAEELRNVLIYELDTGRWYWRVALGTQRKGSQAGSIDDGYWKIRIRKNNYRCCRLAVLYVKGHWPQHKVDHRNRNTLDDKWENLREASNSQNAANSKRNSRNQSGYKGVRWMPRNKKWQARIRVAGQLKTLGLHDTAELAHAAHVTAAQKEFGEFANAG